VALSTTMLCIAVPLPVPGRIAGRGDAGKARPVDSIWIKGGNRLNGEIPISGAKNAALTLLPCALLT
jgi:hypothetical protein